MFFLNIFTEIFQEALAWSWVDWVVTVTALVYVVLAARENVWGWVWGIVSCGLWGYASFFFYHLWLDALLQLFYVVMGVVGIYNWSQRGRKTEGLPDQKQGGASDLPITRLSSKENLVILVGGSVVALLFGYFFDVYTPAAATYLDAFVTVFSIVTTFMLVQKKLDNWAYWVAIDGVSVYLFFSRGAYLFAFIMIIYTLIAANAFIQWLKTYTASLSET